MKENPNNLYADISYASLSHAGEEICGDHVEMVNPDENSTVVVLADGLGSGVKAGILSTLTSKIISTLLAEGLPLKDAVETIASTLPICSVRGIGYSTFTIIRLIQNEYAEIIQYDDPKVLLLRNGRPCKIAYSTMEIGSKKICRAQISLQENDMFVAVSDGITHAGAANLSPFGWGRQGIFDFMKSHFKSSYTSKTMVSMLLEKINDMYDGTPADDATACVIRLCQKSPLHLMVGPPFDRKDDSRMMSRFFAKKAVYIICGGTTSTIAADYLHETLVPQLESIEPDVPPTAQLKGVDLVTEGVITLSHVLEYAQDYLKENRLYSEWSTKNDGASQIARMLFEDATDINFFVGRAVNPAHQNPRLPIQFNIKMHIVDELSFCLTKMGKKVKIDYF